MRALVVEALSRDPMGSRTGDGYRGTTVGQVLSRETSFVSKAYGAWTRVRFPPPPPIYQQYPLVTTGIELPRKPASAARRASGFAVLRVQ
jgi:hypothetical protein